MPNIPTGPRRPAPSSTAPVSSRHARVQSDARAAAPYDGDAQEHKQAAKTALDNRGGSGPQAADIKPAAPNERRRTIHDAILTALKDENVRYAPEQVSLRALQADAFAQGLPFLVLAHVPKYGPPTDLRPCSLWCSDEETEHNSQGHADWSQVAHRYRRSTLFITQADLPHIIDLGILADLQDPVHPKRAVTSFLQLNEPQELQEPGRQWQLRATASIYLASEHAGACMALSTQLAGAIPKDAQSAIYTDVLLHMMADRQIKLALQCIQRGADLGQPTDAGTTPLAEATLRAPIILLRRLLQAGLRPEHADALNEAVALAQTFGLHDRLALLQTHLAEITGFNAAR